MLCFLPLALFVEKRDFRKLFEKLGYTALDIGLVSKLFHSNFTIFSTKKSSFLGGRFVFKVQAAALLNLPQEEAYYTHVWHRKGRRRYAETALIDAIIIKTDFPLPYAKIQKSSWSAFSGLSYLNKPLFEVPQVSFPFNEYNFYTDMTNPDTFLDFFTGAALALFKKEKS
jgi:hypothetical protein